MTDITINLGGIPLRLKLKYDNYVFTFSPFETNAKPVADVCLNEADIRRAARLYPEAPDDSYIECAEMCRLCCDALLPFDRAVFHALSFLWCGKAWLITAPSGTGKSTHYVQWKLRYGDEITLMNGDKPILDFSGHEISVCPSPWYGKEGMHNMLTAPLGGIVLLEQAAENSMRRISPREAAGRIFMQFLFSADNKAQVDTVAGIETRLLESVPVWLLRNLGDSDSAKLCHDTIMKELCLDEI